jgi:hypothetical protein
VDNCNLLSHRRCSCTENKKDKCGQDEVNQGFSIRHVPLCFSTNNSRKRQTAPRPWQILCLQHCAKRVQRRKIASPTEEFPWNLTSCTGRHSGGKESSVSFNLSNGGSLAMIRNFANCGLRSEALYVLHLICHFQTFFFLLKECC